MNINNPFVPKSGIPTNSTNPINTRGNINSNFKGNTGVSQGNTMGFPSSNIGNNPTSNNRFSNGGKINLNLFL